jgi:hypothetical protein
MATVRMTEEEAIRRGIIAPSEATPQPTKDRGKQPVSSGVFWLCVIWLIFGFFVGLFLGLVLSNG